MLQRIKKLEEEANYQVLKPLPDSISVSGDLRISLLDIDDCCVLKSERHQVSRAFVACIWAARNLSSFFNCPIYARLVETARFP